MATRPYNISIDNDGVVVIEFEPTGLIVGVELDEDYLRVRVAGPHENSVIVHKLNDEKKETS